jgi:hypothetical protein
MTTGFRPRRGFKTWLNAKIPPAKAGGWQTFAAMRLREFIHRRGTRVRTVFAKKRVLPMSGGEPLQAYRNKAFNSRLFVINPQGISIIEGG